LLGAASVSHQSPGPGVAKCPPPSREVHAYISGDTIWMLEADELHLLELLEQLP
jgi:hypothetical protein